MTGPAGSQTNRDKRRQTRQQQLRERQLQRQREIQRKLRRQRIQRISVIASAVVLVALIAFLIVHAATGNNQPPAPTTTITGYGTYTTGVDGTPRDTMSCLGTEGTVIHIHMYLEIYVNGLQVQVPANTGIVQDQSGNACFYPLHVHEGEPNIIHEESPMQATYTLGAFFDVWGQPLSKTQVMQYKTDATHSLVFEVYDANDKLTKYTGDPLNLPLHAHDTIVILYNSPNAKPSPFTAWNGL